MLPTIYFVKLRVLIAFLLIYLHFFIIFSGLLRHNYITLYIFWKIEIFSLQILQNHIEISKWGTIRTIRVWRKYGVASVHYIKSAFFLYTISSLHVKRSESNKVIWYISIMIYTWEQHLQDLVLFKWKWTGMYLRIYRLIREAAVHR